MQRLAILDNRREKSIKHRIEEVLTCIILGYLAGRKSRKAALEWCRNHLSVLQFHMPLKNGIASEASACRILQQVDSDDLSDLLIDWTANLVSTEETVLIADGKGVRASASKLRMERTPYYMNLYDQSTGLCVASIEVGEKDND